MARRHLAVLTLFCLLTTVSSQSRQWGLSASNGGRAGDRSQPKQPKMMKLPKPPKASEYPYSPVWDRARKSGVRLSADLKKTHARPRAEDKALDLGNYNVAHPRSQWTWWTPFDEISFAGPYQRVEVFADKSLRNILQPAPYANIFDVQRGIIGIDWDFKSYDNTPEARLLHLSDLLYASYQRVCVRFDKHVPPRYVVASWVITYDTKRVLSEAYERRGFDPRALRTWHPEDVEFVAMLGTTHGKIVLWMLQDFCRWSQCRVPVAIKTKCAQPPGQPRGWYVMFELGVRNSVKNMI